MPSGGDLPTIAISPVPSPEWHEWREYFERHLGWVPVVMRKMIDRTPDAPLAMTVPAQWPQWFDMAFRSDQSWKPPAPRLVTPKDHRETISEIHRRYGPNFGIKNLAAEVSKRRPYMPPSDDDLRRLYGARHDDPESQAANTANTANSAHATAFSNPDEAVPF